MSTGDARGTGGRNSRREVVYAVIAASDPEPNWAESIRSTLPNDRVRRVDSVLDIDPRVDPPRPLVAVCAGGQETRRAVDRLESRDSATAVVAVLEEEDLEGGPEAIRMGADDFVRADDLRSGELRRLQATAERMLREDREGRVRRELEEHGADLVGVNTLANGISHTLDHDIIIRRGLWIFAGLTRHEEAALLELRPRPTVAPTENSDASDPTHFERSASFSTGESEIVEERVAFDESWRRIVRDGRVAVLDGRPEDELFAGLEPFWRESPEGHLTLIPVPGNRTTIGVVILGAEGSPPDSEMSRDGLTAMAKQFGSAVENARLYDEVKSTYESLRETQDQLVHAEKFAAVGILAAEIAHEINNPASFVISNLSVMDEYAESITEFLDSLDDRLAQADTELRDDVEALKDEYDISYMREDMDALLSRSLSGMQRIHQVVQDLRYLSRNENEEVGWVELEGLLDATVNLVGHEAKFRAELRRDYDDVPQVMSNASRLSQVFLNLLVNAVQAIEEGDVEDNYVRIGTRQVGDSVVVSVEDTGTGIDEEAQDRIFDAFYTTKETGEGTGLGLSIARDIVRSLGGSIAFETEEGEGTEFRVTLPIRAEQFEEDRDLRDSGYYETPPGLEDVSDDIFGS